MVFRYIHFISRLIIQNIFHNNKKFKSFNVFINTTKFKNKEFKIIKDYRKQLYRNKTDFLHTDYGAGNRLPSKKNKTVSEIARISGTNHKKGKLLRKLVLYYRPDQIIELGTSLGLGTLYLNGIENTRITTIEGDRGLQTISSGFFREHNLKNICSVRGDFDHVLEGLLIKTIGKTFLYIDGNHKFSATIKYFELCLKHLGEGSVLLFDDINWSGEMAKAWKNILGHGKIKYGIDMFYLGIIEIGDPWKRKNYLHI